MRFFLTITVFFCSNCLFAQKPVIDSLACKEWPSLLWQGPRVSNNGEFLYYTIDNFPLGSKTLVVQSTDGKWKKEFKGGMKDGSQTLSNKYFLFTVKNDSLGMLTLGTDQIKYIPNISSGWRLLEIKGAEYLLYSSSRNPKHLVLKSLKTEKEKAFTDVDSWIFDNDMLILIRPVQSNNQKQSINLANINTGRISKIWEGHKPENLILDVKHRQLAFKTSNSVWYYKFNSGNAICISDKNSSGIESGLTLGYLESFSKDGKFIFTSLNGKGEPLKPKNGVVEIWSYTDVQLQTEQEKAVIDQKYIAVIDVEDHRLIRLQQQAEEWFQFSKSGDNVTTVALVESAQVEDTPWNIALQRRWDLVSLKNGNRRHLDFLNLSNIGNGAGLATLSPCGKYIVYFDKQQQAYFSYEIATERIRNLTKEMNVSLSSRLRDDLPGALSSGRGIAAWLKDDESMLLYDRYDVWRLDPLNNEKPTNLTNGYGRKNDIVFNLTFDEDISRNSRLYLTAFNIDNKDNGFFLKQLDKAGDPELLHMGPYLYQTNSGYVPDNCNVGPMKTRNADIYIARRMSATDGPNYFSTRNFKTFTRLTDLQPQKRYNWYTAELHRWNSFDGRKLQGILYKPENFDPNKKYPVIFHYYERKSDGLNAFIKPEVDGNVIDIPTYVSNGYLVFTPDIYYKIGDPMQGTYDAVVSAASYLSTMPFINDKKMGLQGISYGGLQTNYIVTHSDKFAAAVSTSGLSNMVSAYGDIYPDGGDSMEKFFETGQIRMGKTLWEAPDSYIKNSPIFNIHRVKTPVLIVHTKKDGTAASYKDAQQFFTGLRRMGKKAWMLAYSESNHGVSGKEGEDASIRMMQFFDHYLKDKPAPLWMVDGVSAENRSWKASLELDTKGRTPGPGLLTPLEYAKVDSLITRKPITITLK